MFIDYNENKEKVLARYDEYVEFVKMIDSKISDSDLSKSQTALVETFKRIDKAAINIRADRFRIMVAGEAKSGKSTFINAYLGVELLPMDVKQCTSSIVEIKYGEQFKLVATYANGKQETLTDEEEIKNFLKVNAAINDNYRDIPVPTINHNLLVKYGKMGKDIPKIELNAFLANEQVRKANIYKIDNYNEKIKKFINDNKATWQKIVTKIEIRFPFEDDALRGIEIVDSPGVCALGGVEEFTAGYIENANAIIFLKPISGQALEASQFNEFMKNKSVERNKNTLFLVLTRSTSVTPAEKEALTAEAHRQFDTQLPKQNILVVDSKAEIYANDFSKCESFGEVKEKINTLKDNKQLDDFVQADRGEADGDKDEFIRLLRKRSGFKEVDAALSTFGHKAHYILMYEMLENILKVYRNYYDYLTEYIGHLKMKAEDPALLSQKIVKIQSELDNLFNKMHKGTYIFMDKYSGDNGEIVKTANNAEAEYLKKIEEINASESGAIEKLKSMSLNKIDEFKTLQAKLQKDAVTELNKELVNITDENKLPYTALEPDFSEKDFEEIIASTKNSAEIRKEIEPAKCFKAAKYGNVYSSSKHFIIVRDDIVSRIGEIKTKLVNNLESFLTEIQSVYINKLSENINAKKDELNQVENAKLAAEQIIETIGVFDEFTKTIEARKGELQSVIGGFKEYVQ